MQKKVFILIFLLAILVIADSIYSANHSLNKLIQERAQKVSLIRQKEYNVIYNNKKQFLDSFAKFLSNSKPIIDGYLENNRTKIINFIMPLYKNLYPTQIEEIHFFKKPAISFVNFTNLNVYNINVGKSRADILWVDTSFSPSTHFYICRLYPGLRATYPIIYKDRLLGSVSFGISIKEFKKVFEHLDSQVAIYIKDSNLKKFLLPERYKKFEKYQLINGYRVIGKPLDINFKGDYLLKGNYVYTKIKTKDFFNHIFAYIVIKDDISQDINIIKQHIKNDIILAVVNNILVLLIVIVLFRWIFKRLSELHSILDSIKHHKFSEVPKKVKIKDECDVYKNEIIDIADDLNTYIKLLTQKVQKYEIKAYKDGLTHIFNRTFLEDKAKELFLKYKISKMPVGIIMLDVDNFKNINDTYGHDIGDLVLVNLANTIQNIIRKDDYFIRYGWEEFLLILEDSNILNTKNIAEKIRKSIESLEIEVNDTKIKFTISLGITEIYEDDESLYNAIKRADIHLYNAKKAGKNRVEL